MKEEIKKILEYESDLCLEPTLIDEDDCEIGSPACIECQTKQICQLIEQKLKERDKKWIEEIEKIITEEISLGINLSIMTKLRNLVTKMEAEDGKDEVSKD